MSEALMQLVMTILAAVATGAISIGVAFLQSKIKDEKVGAAIGRLGETTVVTVGELQHTVVDSWKQAGGGKLNAEQIARLKDLVTDMTREKLGDPTVKLIEATGASIDELITGYAEDAVRKIKETA